MTKSQNAAGRSRKTEPTVVKSTGKLLVKKSQPRIGRPPLAPELVRKNHSVALNDSHVLHAKKLGKGNLTQGVVLLIEESMRASTPNKTVKGD